MAADAGERETRPGPRLHRIGWVRGPEARVAYLEDAHRTLVVTVMWVTD